MITNILMLLATANISIAGFIYYLRETFVGADSDKCNKIIKRHSLIAGLIAIITILVIIL